MRNVILLFFTFWLIGCAGGPEVKKRELSQEERAQMQLQMRVFATKTAWEESLRQQGLNLSQEDLATAEMQIMLMQAKSAWQRATENMPPDANRSLSEKWRNMLARENANHLQVLMKEGNWDKAYTFSKTTAEMNRDFQQIMLKYYEQDLQDGEFNDAYHIGSNFLEPHDKWAMLARQSAINQLNELVQKAEYEKAYGFSLEKKLAIGEKMCFTAAAYYAAHLHLTTAVAEIREIRVQEIVLKHNLTENFLAVMIKKLQEIEDKKKKLLEKKKQAEEKSKKKANPRSR